MPTARSLAVAAAATLLSAAAVCAEVRTETVEYTHEGTTFRGYLAYDDRFEGPRPGVLVVHEWWGLNDFPKQKARELAELGYVAFCPDIYGGGRTVTTPGEAQALAGPFYVDRALFRTRVRLGLDQLRGHERVDAGRLGAIGYCFGGSAVLELARSGADVGVVVSFHGGLSTPTPADARNIRAKVVVCNGADDPMVPSEEREAFHREMRDARVDYLFIDYGGAVHSFTNPGADRHGIPGVAYNAAADRRSWEHMKAAFAEAFAEPRRRESR